MASIDLNAIPTITAKFDHKLCEFKIEQNDDFSCWLVYVQPFEHEQDTLILKNLPTFTDAIEAALEWSNSIQYIEYNGFICYVRTGRKYYHGFAFSNGKFLRCRAIKMQDTWKTLRQMVDDRDDPRPALMAA